MSTPPCLAGPEDKRSAVEQILASSSFRRRETSKRLLSYLLQQHLDGRDDDGNEYTVAANVFGRTGDYDPASDATVRVAVGKLREQLEHYYLTEGAKSTLAVSIPRRHYRLHFEDTRAGSTTPAVPEIPALPEAKRSHRVPLSLAVTALGFLLAGAVIGMALARQPEKAGPPGTAAAGNLFREFWQPIRDSNLHTLVSLGTPLFIRYDGHRLRASSVEDFSDALGHEPMLAFKRILKSKRFQESRNYTGVGEAHAAFLVGNLLSKQGVEAKLVRNNALTWEEVGSNNVIFLGPPKFNPHITHVPVMRNYLITGAGIRNVNPKEGEPAMYRQVNDGEPSDQTIESHVVVSRLPGIYQRGRIYVFASTATYGTWAAGICATQPTILEPVLQRVAGNNKQLPPYFEILIRAKFVDNVPVAMEYVSHREVQAQHPSSN